MNLKAVLAASTLYVVGIPLWATTISTSTAKASPDAPVEMISPGRYTASIMPGINGDMAKKLEESIGKIPGVEKVTALPSDSSIHFTIKDGAKVPISNVQNTVIKTDSDAVMSAPILEQSLVASPGL